MIIFTSSKTSENKKIPKIRKFELMMIMPQLEIPDTSFFRGKNITKFFSRYENMCVNYYVGTEKMIRHFPRYCDMFIGQTIEAFSNFVARK